MTEIIYEVGINANGDLDIAKKMIDVAVAAGCDYVKFQKRNVNLVYKREELDTPRKSPWGKTNRDQKFGLEFDLYDYKKIDKYCKSKGIKWFASPWDLDSLRFLEDFKIPFIKIPSALVTNNDFLLSCRETKIPLIVSTGMCNWEMVDHIEKILSNSVYCMMHCTSTYPTAIDELNLNAIKVMRKCYPQYRIGFSNHHQGLTPMIIAASMGAEMVEFHGTLDRSMYGSDQAASIEPEGVFRLVKHIRGVEKAMGDGEKLIYDSEKPIIKNLRR